MSSLTNSGWSQLVLGGDFPPIQLKSHLDLSLDCYKWRYVVGYYIDAVQVTRSDSCDTMQWYALPASSHTNGTCVNPSICYSTLWGQQQNWIRYSLRAIHSFEMVKNC